MALVLILSLGMISLSQFNAEIASNLRVNTEARYMAEAGIDHALVALKQDWNSAGNLSRTVGSYNYAVSISQINSGSVAQRRIESVVSGPRSSEYLATALVQRVGSGTPLPNPMFGEGIISEGRQTFNGSIDVQGKVHANSGLSLPSPNSTHVSGGASAVLGMPCVQNGNAEGERYCTNPEGEVVNPSPAVAVGVPDYLKIRNDNLPDPLEDWSNLNPNNCGVFVSGKSYRVLGDLNLPSNCVLNNVNLVIRSSSGTWKSLTIPSGATIKNSKVFAEQINFNGNGDLTVEESSIFSNQNMNFNGRTNPGNVTLASGGDITFNGSLGSAFDNETVGLAIIAKGNVSTNGSADVDAVIWSGGTVTMNGGGIIRGGISSVGDVQANGKVVVRNSSAISNPNLPTVPANQSIFVISRK